MKKGLVIFLSIATLYLIIGYIIAEKLRKQSVCDYQTNADGSGSAGPCPNIEKKWLILWPLAVASSIKNPSEK